MPKKLAFNPDALHPVWYKQNVSPPKSWERWDGLVEMLSFWTFSDVSEEVTKRSDGKLVIAVRNLSDPDQKGSDRKATLRFSHLAGNASIAVRRVDARHSNTLAAYKALGSPVYPTQQQVDSINAATQLQPLPPVQLNQNRITLELPVNSLAVLELSPGR